MSCSVDHSTIRPGGFCTGCGMRIEQVEAPIQQSEPAINYCPNGHAVSSKKKFCETCGTPMTGFGSAPASAGHASPSGTSAHIPPPPPPQPGSGAGFAAQSQPSTFSAYPTNSMMPPKKNNIGLFIGLGIAGVLITGLILSIVFKGSDLPGGVFAPQTTTVSATMSIKGQYCSNLSWGYSDIPSGSVILSVDGVPTGYASYSAYGTDTSTSCDFDAYFYDIPTDGTVYSIRMASGLRGTIENYKYELESNGWQFNLSLG
jgi:hypothetical protein